MLRMRLVYEQIEAAKEYLQSGSLLDCRLALILLDNAAELIMHRWLSQEFRKEDSSTPKWEPARTMYLQRGLGRNYTQKERNEAEREFEPKTRILCLRLCRISAEDRHILKVCHKLRCETFHHGILRHKILKYITTLLYLTIVDLTTKNPVTDDWYSDTVPAEEDLAFLERFDISDERSLISERGRWLIADRLRDGITFDIPSFLSTLANDLIGRINETLGGLETLGETNDRLQIDRYLQYKQFWKALGANLMENGNGRQKLEEEFVRWQKEGNVKYTLYKIDRWRRQAEKIRSARTPAEALDSYWAVDKRLLPLQKDVERWVFDYEEEINLLVKESRSNH